jgi:hypothetical protein
VHPDLGPSAIDKCVTDTIGRIETGGAAKLADIDGDVGEALRAVAILI